MDNGDTESGGYPMKVVRLAAVPPGLPPGCVELKEEDKAELPVLIRRLEEKRVIAMAVTYSWMAEDGTISRLRLMHCAEGQSVYLCGLVAVLQKRVQQLEDQL